MPSPKPHTKPEVRAMLWRAQRARTAIKHGADPALMLAEVVWPSHHLANLPTPHRLVERATTPRQAA